eukprot:m.198064 g.198064  ORF g.198064 m.198064 type:complete len:785 (-) comp15714_c0_seq20:2647-5001(-)
MATTAEKSPNRKQKGLSDTLILTDFDAENRDTNGPGTSNGAPHQHLTENELLFAVTLMKDAQAGRESVYTDDPDIVRSYRLYYSSFAVYFMMVVVTVHIGLILFETPGGALGLEQPAWVTVPIELICLTLYILRARHLRTICSKERFWNDRKNITVMGVIAICFLDALLYLGLELSGQGGFRFARFLRPLIYINFSEFKQIRRALRSIRKTMWGVINTVILLLLTILIFALLFNKLFRDKRYVDKSGEAYFERLDDSFFDLYVLVTSANFPDVMMPAYYGSRWYAVGFAVFLVITMYMFLSIVLAVVYSDYRKHLKEEIKSIILHKREVLGRLYNVLTRTGESGITFEQWQVLVSRLHPEFGANRIVLLWRLMDEQQTGYVSARRFRDSADILNISLVVPSSGRNIFTKTIPRIYNSKQSVMLKELVRSRYFTHFFDLVIIVNAILIAVDVDDLEPVFLTMFTLEILLKVYTYGPRRFSRNGWNRFDFIVVFGCILVLFIASVSNLDAESERTFLDILLTLRVLRIAKVIGGFVRFRVVISTIGNIFNAIAMYGAIVLTMYYVFAIVGMDLFAGKIYEGNSTLAGGVFLEGSPFYIDIHAGNPKLEGTEFASNGYYANNFNDFLAAVVVLLELTVVNQWHVLTEGFVVLTSKWARIYFVIFHLVTVVLIMNIFIAFIIEAFVLQLALNSNDIKDRWGDKVEEEILKTSLENSEIQQFKVDTKAKRLEIFLQRMFDEEVTKELAHLDREHNIAIAREDSEEEQGRSRAPTIVNGPLGYYETETEA